MKTYKITLTGSGTTEEIAKALKELAEQISWKSSKKFKGDPRGDYWDNITMTEIRDND